MDKIALANNIKRLRKRVKMSQEVLASRAGVARRAIQLLEGAEANPTLDTLCAVAQALNVSLDELVGRPHAAKTAVAEALARSTTPQVMPRDLALGLEFLSKFADLQEDLQIVVLALVYQDPTYTRLVSPEFRAQLALLLKASGK